MRAVFRIVGVTLLCLSFVWHFSWVVVFLLALALNVEAWVWLEQRRGGR